MSFAFYSKQHVKQVTLSPFAQLYKAKAPGKAYGQEGPCKMDEKVKVFVKNGH